MPVLTIDPDQVVRAVRQPHPAAFPPGGDRGAWAEVLAGPGVGPRVAALLAAADGHLAAPLTVLPASLYLDFWRTGDRARFEAVYFGRRHRLADLVLAECCTWQGRYLDAAADALWAICEESTWVLPAHRCHGGSPDARLRLPGARVLPPDLFACETAAVLTQAVALLGPQLDGVSPALVERVRREVVQRVIEPVEALPGGSLWLDGWNNWTPWCAANTLIAATATIDRPERLGALIERLVHACNRFIDRYGEDGGCDEGAMYWGVAGGQLLMFAEELDRCGVPVPWTHPKLRAMARFPAVVHLGGRWFPTFADARPGGMPRASTLWRWGERTGEPALQRLAWLALRGGDPAAAVPAAFEGGNRTVGDHLFGLLRELWWLPAAAIAGPCPGRPPERHTWLPDLQLLAVRGERLVVAAKAGHNGESHNHNDVGQWMALADGHPLIVDAGIGSYTAATFGPGRYQQWCIRGSGHAVPVVGGHEQVAGAAFAARAVGCSISGERVELSADLAGCYPVEAGIQRLERRLVGEGDAVTVSDRLEAAGAPAVEMRLLAALAPQTDGASGLLFTLPGGRRWRLAVEGAALAVEPCPLDDALQRTAWGVDRLWWLVLRMPVQAGERRWSVRLAPA